MKTKANCVISLWVLSCILFSGCMVGPDYHPPVEMMPDSFAEDRTVEPDRCVDEELAHWWTYFEDPFLDSLLAESLQGSFDWKIALQKIRQSRAAYWVQTTALLPEIDSDVQMTRSRTSQTLASTEMLNIPPIQNFYQAGYDAIWTIDIFGGLRRASRSAYDTWEATIEDARGVRIMVLSEVAMIYTNICALQQIEAVAVEMVRLDEDLLSLSESRFLAGLVDEQEVEMAVANLETDRAQLLVVETNLRQAIYSLAVLLGVPPESLLERFLCVRAIPSSFGAIPVGLPSELLRRRPDIRSAERQLAAATEQIGVAVAALFPQFSLTGSSASFSANPLQGANYGYASSTLSKWFTAPSRIWGIGILMTLPIFDFGKRWAAIGEQVSLEQQAFLTYEKTVIAALEEVESDLVAYFNEERRLAALLRETEATRRIFDLTSDLYRTGLASFTDVLTSEEDWLTAYTQQLSSEQALTTNLIALYKALGGGWECSYMP
jgi:multidrug efflux system outer membrane protein